MLTSFFTTTAVVQFEKHINSHLCVSCDKYLWAAFALVFPNAVIRLTVFFVHSITPLTVFFVHCVPNYASGNGSGVNLPGARSWGKLEHFPLLKDHSQTGWIS